MGRVSEEKSRSEKIRDGESQKKEDARARKGRNVAIHRVFPMICGSGGSKSRLAKVAGAEPSGQMSHEKLHAVVARSTCGSQKCKRLTVSNHFWKLRCRNLLLLLLLLRLLLLTVILFFIFVSLLLFFCCCSSCMFFPSSFGFTDK